MKNKLKIHFIFSMLTLVFSSCENPLFIDVTGLHKVEFETNGGSPIESVRTDSIKLLPVTEKDNCDFMGWYEDSSFSGKKINFPYSVKKETVLYARWNQKYRVFFESNGGTNIQDILVSEITSLITPVKDDYTFAGWFDNPAFSGEEITAPYLLSGETTLYAKWNKKYTVTFNSNGGSETDSIKTGLLTELPSVYKENFIFDGWYVSPGFAGTAVSVPFEVSDDITLYAKYLPTYLVEFETYGGTEISSYRARTIDAVYNPEKSGFTFTGWFWDENFTNEVSIPYELKEDVKLYACYRKNYTVTFVTNGGTAVKSITGYKIDKEPETTMDEKTFAGWYTSSELTEESKISFPYEPDSDITLYAKWSAQMWTITYDSNGATEGEVPAVQYVEKGQSFTVSSNTGNLAKNGYAFTKWSTTKTGASGQSFSAGQSVTPTGNMKLYAQWGKNYSAMIYVEGGTFTQGTGTSGSSQAHSVTISKDFYMGQYEVTYELWAEVKAWASSQETAWNVGSANKGVTTNDSYTDWEPATYVSWYEAVTWCNAYSEMKGLTPCYYSDSSYTTVYRDYSSKGYVYWDKSANGYRLPTESEWEYAAKGGVNQNTYTYSGSNTISVVAWYYGNSGSETHPVGTKAANKLGIYDMSGNVEEWCGTSYYSYSSDAQTDPNYWSYSSSKFDNPIYRGGSWSDGATAVTSRSDGDYGTDENNYTGFRVVRYAE